jgi:hypothetical protein
VFSIVLLAGDVGCVRRRLSPGDWPDRFLCRWVLQPYAGATAVAWTGDGSCVGVQRQVCGQVGATGRVMEMGRVMRRR